MSSSLGRITLLLFGSGFCALVYQTAWLRMFRLVFGASTAASAAVLAIFMAGLGFGGLLLGRWVDRQRNPLGIYAWLEAGIAILAGLSPSLVELVQTIYIALGGSSALGLAGGSAVRLLLSALVLGLPTFLMGGTLPAIARAVERGSDQGRRVVGLLYAVNTLGAVLGTLATTFWSLEMLGIRRTIWVAALINLLVALWARRFSAALEEDSHDSGESGDIQEEGEESAPAGAWLVAPAAGLVGFAFLLMELVWYRMLSPLLGGSSYTFGLILAVALLGIGLGGLMYGSGERQRRPTLISFAATCSLEALLLALPFALGDRLAVLAAVLRPVAGVGFLPLVLSWAVVTVIVVFPAALVAGYQFPMLIGLLGRGRRRLGREIGVTYAANTVGAIAGSIAGGFGLLPLLSATGVWRLAAALLLLLAAVAVIAGVRGGAAGPGWRSAAVPLALGALGLLFCASPGPSAFWRHSPIGAGRLESRWSGPNELRQAIELRRRSVVWERDGVESSVALDVGQEISFLVNGKADGSARADAPTQIMGGLVGALLHPNPKRALVIGLGTGSTAGWLAAVPSIERVDVIELEPAVVHVAEVLSAVNHDVLRDPKVHLVTGDGRELLLTSSATYDIIFSEPSNPYRAGVASLFTSDFYEAVRDRLRPGGLLLQWLQGYELDAGVVGMVYATLGAVFPAVESWEINAGDLLLVASREPLVHDAGRVRARLALAPYREALRRTWGVDGVEGFYSGYIASPAFARAMGSREGRWVNTDDHPILEFGFARNVGRFGLFRADELIALARSRGENRPAMRGVLDWDRAAELRMARQVFWREAPVNRERGTTPEAELRLLAREAYSKLDLPQTCRYWFGQPAPPEGLADLLMAAECLAGTGDPRAAEYAERLRAASQPTAAELIVGLWHARTRRGVEAGRHLAAAFRSCRQDPWVNRPLLERGFKLAPQMARRHPQIAPELFAAASEPCAVRLAESDRLHLRIDLARLVGPRACVEALDAYEPHGRWEEAFLAYRVRCYEQNRHPRIEQAREDLYRFLDDAPPRLDDGLPKPGEPIPEPGRS